MRRAPTAATAATAVAAALLAVLGLLALTGCEETKEKAGNIVASATAAAQEQMNQIKNGVDAKGDVKAGPTSTDGDRTVATVTATNPKDSTVDYTIWVNFRDKDGNLLDAVVMNINDVGAKAVKTGTARSNRSLSGATKAEIVQAVRH
ncbi:hypothetical protein ACIRSU_20825 [Streptomyces sp. NPDC101160]|uniref:hypothetical protein n=1 Tax=Streptomyces sp. NPDC101160 TaxID=3366118 RepID=UPI003801283F